jgi:chromosome segregation ATPase
MSVAGEQVKELLENLMDRRNLLKQKVETDTIKIVTIKAELGELEDAKEGLERKLEKAGKLRKQYDQNIQETQEAIENLENVARRFASTFASLGKLRKEAR